jgi:hypothetical protein
LNGFEIGQKRLLLLRFAGLHLAAGASRGENRHRDGSTERPDPGGRRKKPGQIRAGVAERSGKRNGREISRPGDADSRVGGDEILLGQPRRHGRKRELVDAPPALHRTRIASQEKGDGVFLLGDRLLDLGNRRTGVFVFGKNLA